MNITLRLQHLRQPIMDANAWFIPGHGPQAWLPEIRGWNVRSTSITLHPVPSSPSDRCACGVLVVVDGQEKVHPSPHVHPYFSLIPGFFIPVDGEIVPPVLENELSEQCRYQVHIFHPTVGLVGLDTEDSMGLHDLFSRPTQREANWSCPHPGISPPMKLRRVARIMPSNIEEIIDRGKQDIGAQKLEELPSLPSEQSRFSARNSFRKLHLKFVQTGLRLTSLVPAMAPSKTWINTLESWLVGQHVYARANLEQIRNKEIYRLLDLMQNQPNEGLKFAIPLDSNDHRGRVQDMGATLGAHDVDFNLHHLGGGKAASSWNISNDLYQQLRQVYIKAASEELVAGRFRRAAYIYSSLLKDNYLAAQALVQGRHFHEAAELYRKHLKKPLLAAECLAEGGLLSDAATLFEELKKFEKAGDLYLRLGDEERARASFQAAVAKAQKEQNILAAAQLLDLKLGNPDEALELLSQTWPDHTQAESCLGKRFELLGRLGRHQVSAELVGHLRAETRTPTDAATLIRIYCLLHDVYPDQIVRDHAADEARVTAGQYLLNANFHHVESLVQALRSIDKKDHLFSRDTQRYQQARSNQVKLAIAENLHSAKNRLKSSYVVEKIRNLEVPSDVKWCTGVGTPWGFLVGGFRPGELVVAQGPWSSVSVVSQWELKEASGSVRESQTCLIDLHLAAATTDIGTILVTCNGSHPEIPVKNTTIKDGLANSIKLGRPAWIPDDVICINTGCSDEIWAIRFRNQAFSLVKYSVQGQLINNYELDFKEEKLVRTISGIPCHIIHENSAVFATVGQSLYSSTIGLNHSIHLPEDALGMSCASPHLARRLVVAHPHGASVVWLSGRSQKHFAKDLDEPLVLFIPTGALIVVGKNEGRVYSTTNNTIKLKKSFPVGPGLPQALMKGLGRDAFAVLFDDGKITHYRVGNA